MRVAPRRGKMEDMLGFKVVYSLDKLIFHDLR